VKSKIARFDYYIGRVTDHVTSLLLVTIVLVVLYSVLMRYVFNHPPFWSDRLSIFANIGMILLGLSLTVRHGDLIAMQALYEKISPMFALMLDALWNFVILAFSMVYAWYGLEAALIMPGQYWDFMDFCIDMASGGDNDNIVYQTLLLVEKGVGVAVQPFCVDGAIPQKYMALLMPVSGLLLVISSLGVIVGDARKISALRLQQDSNRREDR
jgi:TRAP-type C4-dicarboxylate transport system permease small subunit